MFTFYSSKFISPWTRVSWSRRIYRRNRPTLRSKLQYQKSTNRTKHRQPLWLKKDILNSERHPFWPKKPQRVNYNRFYKRY